MSFKSNQRVIWNPITGNPEGNKIGTPGDLLYDSDNDILWMKVSGRQTKTGWRQIAFTDPLSTLSEIYAQASVTTDGAGGFSGNFSDGFSNIQINAPNDLTFTFTEPQTSDQYVVVASGAAAGPSALFLSLSNRTVNGFNYNLFDTTGDVNPLTTVLRVDVFVGRALS